MVDRAPPPAVPPGGDKVIPALPISVLPHRKFSGRAGAGDVTPKMYIDIAGAAGHHGHAYEAVDVEPDIASAGRWGATVTGLTLRGAAVCGALAFRALKRTGAQLPKFGPSQLRQQGQILQA